MVWCTMLYYAIRWEQTHAEEFQLIKVNIKKNKKKNKVYRKSAH